MFDSYHLILLWSVFAMKIFYLLTFLCCLFHRHHVVILGWIMQMSAGHEIRLSNFKSQGLGVLHVKWNYQSNLLLRLFGGFSGHIVSGYSGCYNRIPWTMEIYYSYFWRLESPRQRCRQIQCLVRACFLFHSHLLTVSSDGGKDKASFGGLFYKGTNPFHEGSTLMTYSPPEGLTS